MIPKVSVVMSVYNGEAYLRESLSSVLMQEDVDLELIVVNDGSTDGSGNILQEVARTDRRVRVIGQENEGLTRALIRGCSEARGEYIARQDVGDVSHPQRLALQKSLLDADSSLAFVSSWTEFCGPNWEFLYAALGKGLATSPIYLTSVLEKQRAADGPTHHGSVMFRRSAYLKAGGYRAEFYYAQDWDLWHRMAEVGRFQMIEKTLYKSRVLPEGISMNNRAYQEALVDLSMAALRRRLRGLPEEDILEQTKALRPQGRKVRARTSHAAGLYFIGECLRRNGDLRAMDYFRKSVRDSPLFVKSWVRIFQCQLGGLQRNKSGTAENPYPS